MNTDVFYESGCKRTKLEKDSELLKDPVVSFLLEQGKNPDKYLELASHLQWKPAQIKAVEFHFFDNRKLFVHIIEFPNSHHIQGDLTGCLIQSYIMTVQCGFMEHSDYSEKEGVWVTFRESRNGEFMSNFGSRWNGMTSEEKRSIAFSCNEDHYCALTIEIKHQVVSSILSSVPFTRPNTYYGATPETWRLPKESRLPNEEQKLLTAMISPFSNISGYQLDLEMNDILWIAINDNSILLAEYQDNFFD